MSTQPTDDELQTLWAASDHPLPQNFARAVLALWGTPATGGKPWGAFVEGRVFIGNPPEHVRKLAESEGWVIQWLYTSPQPVREPLSGWIDPNDKTQAQYLPHIGEPVLFCAGGHTYYGKHSGGSFVAGVDFATQHFNTWECRWQYPPVAHGITGGQT